MKARLVLENGSVFEGVSFGYEGELSNQFGEVVFNTAMCGYQELLTDPSYAGQIVNLTYPLIGNYGVNEEDNESRKVWLIALIVREYQNYYSNYRATRSLANFLQEHKIIAIQGIDTRALTRILRDSETIMGYVELPKTMKGYSSESIASFDVLLGKHSQEYDILKKVTSKKNYCWNPTRNALKPQRHKIVALDFGVKYNSLRMLEESGASVEVVKADSSLEDILSLNPSGVFLSNGPGDPRGFQQYIDTVKTLLGKLPLFGICLGYQIVSLALGARVYKLKFGHRGGNHPIKNLKTGKVFMSSQNHGFAVSFDSLPSGVDPLYVNLHDGSLEGFISKEYCVLGVQYHPEASPGPRECVTVFDDFIQLMTNCFPAP